MKTYYARHTKISIADSAIKDLRQRYLIAIHYPEAKDKPLTHFPDSESTDPDDYQKRGAKTALTALNSLAKEGGYVVAQYRHEPTLVVGKVKPGSQIRLERAVWDATREGSEIYRNRVAVLKTLAYDKICELDAGQLRNALAIAPQFGSLSKWHKIGNKVRNLAEGVAETPSVSDLHHSDQEVLCAEFLRTPTIPGIPTLASLLMRVGGTTKGIDICGVATDGKLLVAQVKYDHEDQEVEDFVARYANADCHLIFFSGVKRTSARGPLHLISLDEVYASFCGTERGANWLHFVSSSL